MSPRLQTSQKRSADGRGKMLTAQQRTMLAQIARRAWARMDQQGAIDESFDDWRLREARRACGGRISEAAGDSFDDLFIHFKALAGEMDDAFERAASKVTNAQRQVHHEISRACEDGGVTVGYALEIARDKWGSKLGVLYLDFGALVEMPLHALKTVLYDVRRGMRRRLKTQDSRLKI